MVHLSAAAWDRPWWVKALLALSIALNIFLVAFLFGQLWQAHSHHADGQTWSAREVLRQLERRLPEKDAQVLRHAFGSRAKQIGDLQREHRATVDRVRQDVGAAPLDLDKLRADLDASRRARDRLRPLVEQALLEALPQMSEAGRETLSRYRLMPARRL